MRPPDGVHWTEIGQSGPTGDRSTFFYNPFRRVWVFSLRADLALPPDQRSLSPVLGVAGVRGQRRVDWPAHRSRGSRPTRDDYAAPGVRERPELYNLDCVAYESVLLGLFSIWRGESGVREKINEVTVGFSRDGFHWHRPDRRRFLPVSERPGSWNWANVQSAGGGCLVVGDQLYFYVERTAGSAGHQRARACARPGSRRCAATGSRRWTGCRTMRGTIRRITPDRRTVI